MGVGLSNRTLHYYLYKRLYTPEEVVRRKQYLVRSNGKHVLGPTPKDL